MKTLADAWRWYVCARARQNLERMLRVGRKHWKDFPWVRDYRNWAAHGRRDTPTNLITPRAAYDRLKEFLEALDIAVTSERAEPEHE
jgi:hypothetical protein